MMDDTETSEMMTIYKKKWFETLAEIKQCQLDDDEHNQMIKLQTKFMLERVIIKLEKKMNQRTITRTNPFIVKPCYNNRTVRFSNQFDDGSVEQWIESSSDDEYGNPEYRSGHFE